MVVSLYTAHVRSISMDHLKRMMDSGEPLVLVDVRTRNDYDREHIKGAKSLPLDEIEGSASTMIRPEDVVVVYCDSFVCSASTSASKILTRLGYKNIRDYKGGLREWKLSGLPTESRYQ